MDIFGKMSAQSMKRAVFMDLIGKLRLNRQAPPDGGTALLGVAARTVAAEHLALVYAGCGAR